MTDDGTSAARRLARSDEQEAEASVQKGALHVFAGKTS